MYSDIRWTFGLKSSTYDRFTTREVGGTSITIEGDDIFVKHIYNDQAYQVYMDTLLNNATQN